jgi:ribosome-binding protein aMBF1 (putative translation factor)
MYLQFHNIYGIILKNNWLKVIYFQTMSDQRQNPIQIKLAILQEKGWTLAALADELEQKINTLEKWKAGDRNPANEKAVLTMLEILEKSKRIPKKRRYVKGSRRQIEDLNG